MFREEILMYVNFKNCKFNDKILHFLSVYTLPFLLEHKILIEFFIENIKIFNVKFAENLRTSWHFIKLELFQFSSRNILHKNARNRRYICNIRREFFLIFHSMITVNPPVEG